MYKGLKASTTVTMTHTTTTDKHKELQTFVAVVVAGGVAWWAAGKFHVLARKHYSIPYL